MADTSYSYNITSGFPNSTVNTIVLSNEITASTIAETLLHIDTDSGMCYIWFNNALLAGDQTILNSIVSAHLGQALPADGYKSGTNRPPTINDDITYGFYVGYIWLDLTSDQSYICFDNSNGAAIWKQTTCITDHGNLSGLADDDHTQYLLTNGTRSMAGSLNVGGFNITNVGTIDGYNLENEFQIITNHTTNTNNPHLTSIANIGSGTLAQLNASVSDANVVPTTITITAGNGLTGGGDLSANRTINIAAADSSITVNADNIQVGVISDTQHGSRTNGTLHTVATISVNGFMSSTDKTKLDGIASGAQVNPNIWSVFSDGTNPASPGTTSDTFIFRSANSAITTVVGSNDATYGDNLLVTLVPGNITHSSLGSLTSSDDHTQYVHNTTARTITARHTFNPSTTNSPFILGANSLNQLVTGLNSDLLDGYHWTYLTNASNLNAGILPAARFDDTSHGNRSGGSLHSTVSNTSAGFIPTVGASNTVPQSTGTTISYVSELTNPQKVTVARAGVDIGSRSRINFIEGSNVTITTADNSGSGRVDVTIASTGSGGLANAYANIYDGTTTAAASGADTFRFRSANNILTAVVGSNDVTYGDNLLLTINQNNIDHGSIGGLTDDDHSQYVHNTTARTITARHTFNPSTTNSPFILGTNSLNQLVTGLNSDLLDGYHWTYLTNASNLNAGTLLAARFNDTSHGNRSGGSLHSAVSNTANGFVPSVGNDGYILYSTGTAALWKMVKRIFCIEFALVEYVANTEVYFFSWKGYGSFYEFTERSGNVGGMDVDGDCSPIIVPFNATITKAVLALRGAGVQSASVTYPVSYRTRLDDISFTSRTSIGNLNWSISNAYSVDSYYTGDTRFKGVIYPNLLVSEGQMLGLKFINGVSASIVGQQENAVVTLVLEER